DPERRHQRVDLQQRSGTANGVAVRPAGPDPVGEAGRAARGMTTLDNTAELLIIDDDFEPEAEDTFRPSAAGWAARGLVFVAAGFVVLWLPYLILNRGDFDVMCTAVVFAIFGISLNVLLGYTGTISLGHQAFIGIGAFSSAYVVSVWHQP